MNRMGGTVQSQAKNKIKGVNFQGYRNLIKGVNLPGQIFLVLPPRFFAVTP